MPNYEMTYKLYILDSADVDIAEAIKDYERIRNGLSIDFELCLEEGYSDILNAPLGYQIRYKGIRIKFIRRFPYGIHYLVEDNRVIVISVFHQSKNPIKWFKRLSNLEQS